MSDEEKKAIKIVNKRTERLIEELKIEEEDLIDEPKIAYLITQIEANKTIKNLIEKQSKEIEELKEDNKKKSIVIIEYQDLYEKLEDKIKAKIEEVEKELNKLLQKDEWIEPSDTIIRNKFMHYIEFGLSLLEKE